MTENNAIHDFAVKYHSLYVNPQTAENEVVEGFADRCFSFEFKMDCGNRFIEAFSSDALYKNEALNKVIDEIDDVELLGSAIFSHWRYVTHWADNSSLLDEEHRPWFITAFERLAVITKAPAADELVFEGKLRKIKLVSHNIRYGIQPAPDAEVEQRLTIMANGRVWLSRYCFGSLGCELELIEKLSYSIPTDAVDEIMAAVSDYFGGGYDVDLATDIGSWHIVLTNADGILSKRQVRFVMTFKPRQADYPTLFVTGWGTATCSPLTAIRMR